MFGIMGLAAAGGGAALLYGLGYVTRVISSKTEHKVHLVAAGVVPDFFDRTNQGNFTGAITNALQYLDTRERLYSWQRYWHKEDPTPYQELAAQVELLRKWLMGFKPDIRSESQYKRAKAVVYDLLHQPDKTSQRLVEGLSENQLPKPPLTSSLCERIKAQSSFPIDQLQVPLSMLGANRCAYDILPFLKTALDPSNSSATSIKSRIASAINVKWHDYSAWKYLWWVYQPSAEKAETAIRELDDLTIWTAHCWVHLLNPCTPKGQSRDAEFDNQVAEVAECARHILNLANTKDFQGFFGDSYRNIQYILRHIAPQISGLDQPVRSLVIDTKLKEKLDPLAANEMILHRFADQAHRTEP